MNLEAMREMPMVQLESVTYMQDFMKKYNLKTVLEIGTFKGYSAMKFSEVAKKVIAIEINYLYAEEAKRNFDKYNIKNVEIIVGDAKQVLKKIKEKFDLIFIDAMKKEYANYLKLVLPLLSEKGVIFADNTISHKEEMEEFFEYINKNKIKHKELELGRGLLLIEQH